MKLTLYPLLLILLLGTGLCACKKEEPKGKTQEELLVGKWQLLQAYDLMGLDVANDCDRRNQFEFFPDKSMHWYSYENKTKGCTEYIYQLTNDVTYTVDGNIISFHWVVKPESGTGKGALTDMTFEVDETRLVIRIDPTHRGTIYQRIK
jgi:hypothetical protein